MKIQTMALLASLICGSVLGQDKEPENGLEVGESMPLHVVDFVAGARTSGAGCPSVMISNGRARGIEIWSNSQSDNAIELAAAIDDLLVDDDQAKAFLVMFNGASRKSYVATPQEKAFKKVMVAVPRGSRKQIFEKADENRGSSLIVFFMDRKVIKSRLNFKQAEPTADQIQTLAESAGKFVAGE